MPILQRLLEAVRLAERNCDSADTSLTLTGCYNTKLRETPDRESRLIQARSATNGDVLKPLGKDS